MRGGGLGSFSHFFLFIADIYMYMFAAMHNIAILSTQSNDSSILCFNKPKNPTHKPN